MTTNTHRFLVTPFDWTKITTQVNSEGKREFEKVMLDCDELEKDQLLECAKEYQARDQRAFELARSHRKDLELLVLSSMRNWSRQQAVRILIAKKAGKPIRKDFLDVFESLLKEEVTTRITELEQAWQMLDEHQQQQVMFDRQKAFQDNHQPLISAYSALEQAYTGREQAVQAGYNLAKQYAERLDERMGRHEHYIEHMGRLVLGMMQNAAHRQQRRWEVPWGCLTLAVAIALPLVALFVWNLILK